jgi:exopolysaccharide biosynthesis WecB/TagA/CpsF family protein
LTTEEKQQVVEEIKGSGAKVVFVGLGCPRQETWAFEYRLLLNRPIVAVGAAFDFHAGILPQAPAEWQHLGLEWLFRLIQEPQRLYRRYLLLNPLYLWNLFLQRTHLKQFQPGHPDGTEPVESFG